MGVAIGYALPLVAFSGQIKESHILLQVDNTSSVAILPMRKFVDMIGMTAEITTCVSPCIERM